MTSLEDKTREEMIEKEKNRENKEKYKISVFEWVMHNIFFVVLWIIALIWIITLISERNLVSRYEQYKVPFYIFWWIWLLMAICDDIKESREKRYELKPEKQIIKYKYETGFIYTDSLFNVIVYTIYKVIARIASIVTIILWWYLFIVFLNDTVQEMSLKAIVIIWIVIIIGLLIMIFNKLNNRDKND